MAGYIGDIPVPQGTIHKQEFSVTNASGQSTFPTIGFTPGFCDVYLNGIKLLRNVDFDDSNSSDILLTTAAALNDILEVTIFDTFTTSSASFANATLTSSTLKSNVTLKNDTEEDSDGGRASKIIYQGEQSGGEISTLAEIQASHDLAADDQKGDLIFRTNDGSDGTSPTERLRIDSDGNIGVNINAPSSMLHLFDGGTDTGITLQSKVQANATASITLMSRKADNSNVNAVLKNVDGKIQSSVGIMFGSDTADANALDDYETGSFQMTLTGINTTSAVGYGIYAKVGNLCHFSFYSGTVTVTSSVAPVLGGLPFTSISPFGSGGAYPTVSLSHNTWAPNSSTGYINIGSTTIHPTDLNTSGGTATATGSKYVMCSGTYYVA